jgi:hypothetical protein
MPPPSFSPGKIIKLYCDWLQKPKYFLVVSIIDEPLLLWISSKKPTCMSDPADDADFLQLTKAEYTFLDHDSWLDCGEVCKRFTWPSIEYQLKFKMGWICGPISALTKSVIIHAVVNSQRLSTLHQRLICEGL